jgi:hypothetical protein
VKALRSIAPVLCIAALATAVIAEPQPAPSPKEPQPAPKESQPAPKESQPAPKESQPAPKEPQPAPKEAPAKRKVEPKPAAPQLSPEEEAMFQFMAQAGKPNGERTRGVTRGPDKTAIKLVAIAPATVGVTHLESPRIWWWQSEATSPGEMEIELSSVEEPPVRVFKSKLNALPAGFNAFGPAGLGADHKYHLKPGVEYEWILSVYEGTSKSSVIGRIVRRKDLDLGGFKAGQELDPKRIAALSKSGNWYELFDAVAFPAREDPASKGYASIRQKLLVQVGLGGELEAP